MTREEEYAKLNKLVDDGKLSRDSALYSALTQCIEHQGHFTITPDVLALLEGKKAKITEHPFDGTEGNKAVTTS